MKYDTGSHEYVYRVLTKIDRVYISCNSHRGKAAMLGSILMIGFRFIKCARTTVSLTHNMGRTRLLYL